MSAVWYDGIAYSDCYVLCAKVSVCDESADVEWCGDASSSFADDYALSSGCRCDLYTGDTVSLVAVG